MTLIISYDIGDEEEAGAGLDPLLLLSLWRGHLHAAG